MRGLSAIVFGSILTGAGWITDVGAIEFRTVDSDGAHLILASGEFLPGESLSGFVDLQKSTGAKVVVFDSAGGNVGTAMELGRLIRGLGLSTLQVRQLECASACAYAFMGGVSRAATPGSIGVHQSSLAPGNSLSQSDAVAGIQTGTADTLTYLREMGVKPEFLELSLRYTADDIRYLSASEMRELNVTNIDPSSERNIGAGPAPDQPVAAQTSALESAALNFIRELVEQHGDDPGRALARVVTSYSGMVTYYGKSTSLSEVVRDKQTYFQRWPERAYHIRDDTLMVTCANDNCMVSGIYDWVVRSLRRNKQAAGSARFSYTISLSPTPKVVAEVSEVLSK